MSPYPPRALLLRKLLFAALLLLICVLVIHWVTEENKPWIVPPEYKSLKNPLAPSESNLKAARQMYMDECAQCHGDTGKGDGPEARSHYPLPADLTDPKLQENVTDGDIFYQISEGRRPMPSFKRRLTEDQRWQLVLLVRSFSQPPASSGDSATKAKYPRLPRAFNNAPKQWSSVHLGVTTSGSAGYLKIRRRASGPCQ